MDPCMQTCGGDPFHARLLEAERDQGLCRKPPRSLGIHTYGSVPTTTLYSCVCSPSCGHGDDVCGSQSKMQSLVMRDGANSSIHPSHKSNQHEVP